MTHEFLTIYPAKLMEYGLAITYLLLFIPFWSYVQSGRRIPAPARTAAHAPAPVRAAAAVALRPAVPGWFHVPAEVHLHPGHTWARLESDGVVSIGLDDFAHKLVGPAAVSLPALGARVSQGEPAVRVGDETKKVALVAPVDGTVVAVNPAPVPEDPYGAGWLLKVKAPRLTSNLRQLLGGGAARRLLEEAAEELAARVSPELGAVLQDGGAPVSGIARELAGERWDGVARTFFLT
jgi:glycine cleavage system H lipoate-binding protein